MNRNESIMELLHGSLDGTNTPAEEAALSDLLAKDGSLRELFGDLQRIQAALKAVESVEPPEYLKQHIINTLPPFRAPRDIMARFRGWFNQPLLFAHRRAYGFGGGVILGMMLIAILWGTMGRQGEINVVSLYGALMHKDFTGAFHQAGSVGVGLPEAAGSVSAKRSSDLLLVDIAIDAKEEIEIQVSFDGSDYRCVAFERPEGQEQSLRVSDGSVDFALRGNTRCQLLLRSGTTGSSPLTITLKRGPVVLQAISLATREQS